MFAAIVRLLQRQPAAAGSAALAVYAAGVMLYRAYVEHTGVVDTDVLVAAAGALYGLWVRSQVTPVVAPRNNRGQELHPL